jgi:hypothetical protein
MKYAPDDCRGKGKPGGVQSEARLLFQVKWPNRKERHGAPLLQKTNQARNMPIVRETPSLQSESLPEGRTDVPVNGQ